MSKPARLVTAATAVYVISMFWACYRKFIAFGYSDFDLAHHSQSVWNILHGSLDCSILGIPFLGNHMVPILFLAAPLYAVWSSPLLLILLQTIVLASGAIGIFMIARNELPETWACALGLLYLVYPPLIYLNLYEFHPIALATGFLIFAMYFYKADSFRMFCLFLALATACQENVALIAIGLGAYAFIDKRRGRWTWIPGVAGLVYFTVIVFVVMPRLNNNTIGFTKLYGQFGNSLPEILKNMAVHPVTVAATMFTAAKLAFLNALLAPLSYVSLLSPLSLLPALPVFFQRLLSTRVSEATIIYHYQAEFIPFIFFAAIYGLKRALNSKAHTAAPLLAFAMPLLTLSAIIAGGLVPALRTAAFDPRRNDFITARKEALIRNLPADAKVIATFQFLPRLANRRDIYSLHHVYTGKYTLSDVDYPMPDVDYIFMDTADPLTFSPQGFYGPGNCVRLQALLDTPEWRLVDHVESLLVFKNSASNEGAPARLVEFLDSEPANMSRSISEAAPSGNIRLLGFRLDAPDKDNLAPLTLYWMKSKESIRDYQVELKVSGKTALYHGILSPGSRIAPPQSWPTNTIIADKQRIHLSETPASLENVQLSITLHPVDRK